MDDELKEIKDIKERQQGNSLFGQEIRKTVRLEYAKPMQRFFACLFDVAIAVLIFLPFVGEVREVTTTGEYLGEQIVHHEYLYDTPSGYLVLILLLLKLILEASPLQASPGKLLFFTKVTNEDGENVGFFRLLIREIGFILIPFTWLGYFWGEKKQCFHDKLAASYVVKRSLLSDLLFLPAVIITLALSIYMGHEMMSKMTPAHSPVQYQSYPQVSQMTQVNREEALENAIIPEDDKIGSIKVDGEEVAINTVFVRLKDMVRYTSFGDYKSSGGKLEIALFEDQLSPEKLKRLNNVANLMLESKAIVKKNPVALISIQSENFESNCKNQVFNDSDLVINSSYFDETAKENHKIKLHLDEMKLNGLVIMQCDAIKVGSELFFSMQAPLQIGNNSEGVVNVRFTEKVRELKYLGSYVYRHSNPKLVLAVYNKEQQQMRLAFYNEGFSKDSLNTAYIKGILPTSPAPSLILDIPVNGRLYGSGRDIVAKGYTITFKNLPEEIGKGLAHRDYQIKFEPGEIPARFMVQSPHAPQVQGRLEGKKEISSPSGITNLAWNVSFNARLILIKR